MSFLIKVFFKILILIFLVASNSYAEATYVRILNTNSQKMTTGIMFNSDGTKMYTGASRINSWSGVDGSDKVFEFTLTTAFDISTASQSSVVAVRGTNCGSSNFKQPLDVIFNNDGTRIFISNTASNSANDICELNLTTAYDIDSAETISGSEGININGISGIDSSAENASGIAFNSDGSKLFVANETVDKIFEINLSTEFDLSTASYSGIYLSISDYDPAGITFSKDGTALFLIDTSDKKVVQYSLSNGFDLSSTITVEGTFNGMKTKHEELTSTTTSTPRSLAFNGDGSKVYFTYSRYNSTSNSRVLEYDLDCPYGIVNCLNPVSGSDKDLIGVIESYTEMSKRVMKNNIKPVMHRLEWLRRHRKEDNLTNQNLKFNFSNEMLASLSKVIPIANKESSTNEKQKGDWFFWSEGQISIGDIEATSGSSRKELDTNGITIGADKKASENKMYGYALQFGRDSADIGNSAAILDTDNYSLVFYGTIPHEDGRFLDAALGLSTLKTYHLRKKNSVNLSGKRAGKQAFGSIKLNKVYYKKNININPTAKFDFGFTELNTFQESGSNDALIYEKHQIPKGFASLGMLVDKTKKFNNGSVLKPMARLEYTADFSPSTNTNVSYVGTPSTDHFIRIGNQSTHNYNAGLGFDLSTITGWSVILNYEIDYANGSGHTDNLNFIAGWVPKSETEYALSINGSENIKTGFNIVKKVRGFDLKFNIDTDLLNNNKNQNANISLNKVF